MKKIKLNKKKIFSIILIAIIIIVIVIAWSYFNSDEQVINNVNEIIPSEEISDEQLRTTIVSLYFVNKENGELEKESRRIDSKKLLQNPYEEILNLWLEGSENKNLTTGCSKDTKINKIEIEKNCAKVDLTKEFINMENKEGIKEIKIVYCIVNNLTELNEIDSVKILIDGEENVYLNNINLSEEYFRLKE